MTGASGGDVLISFARGQVDWRALAALGVKVEPGETLRIEVPAHCPTVRPRVVDIALGFLSQAEGADIRIWSATVLSLDNIDLSALEGDSDGSARLEALWDAAKGSVPGAALHLVRNIVKSASRD